MPANHASSSSRDSATPIDGRNPDWDTPAYRRLLYCDYTGTLATEDWWVLRPSDESRCGPVRNEGTFEVQAGEEVAVPSRPGAVTLATITPHVPITKRLIGLLGLPAIETIEYGGTEWRWAFGERAEGIILNDPIGHPSLNKSPAVPYPTISVSIPASITFDLMDVESPREPAPIDLPSEP